jgi:hypothetical protein
VQKGLTREIRKNKGRRGEESKLLLCCESKTTETRLEDERTTVTLYAITRDVRKSGSECMYELVQSASQPVGENIPATVRSVARVQEPSKPTAGTNTHTSELHYDEYWKNCSRPARRMFNTSSWLGCHCEVGNGLKARDTAQTGLFPISLENTTDVDQTWTVTFSNPCLQGCT